MLKRIVKHILWIALFVSAFILATAVSAFAAKVLSACLDASAVTVAIAALAGYLWYSLLSKLFERLFARMATSFEEEPVIKRSRLSQKPPSDLLQAMESLQSDSLEARKALIRESFIAKFQSEHAHSDIDSKAILDNDRQRPKNG